MVTPCHSPTARARDRPVQALRSGRPPGGTEGRWPERPLPADTPH